MNRRELLMIVVGSSSALETPLISDQKHDIDEVVNNTSAAEINTTELSEDANKPTETIKLEIELS